MTISVVELLKKVYVEHQNGYRLLLRNSYIVFVRKNGEKVMAKL